MANNLFFLTKTYILAVASFLDFPLERIEKSASRNQNKRLKV